MVLELFGLYEGTISGTILGPRISELFQNASEFEGRNGLWPTPMSQKWPKHSFLFFLN